MADRRSRGPKRPRQARGRSRVGERFEAEVGPIAHGGHCVVRLPEPESRVVFVRHTLPGERVVLRITEGTEGDRFWRADAVEVLEASPARIEPPCVFSGPDACGGCDFQHVALSHQRALEAEVVREQMSRLAKLDVAVTVEPVPGDETGLGWRTRQRFVSLPDGGTGMRKHRSHEVVPVDECLIAGATASHVVREVRFEVEDDGFWQVHPGAPDTLVGAVLEALAPRPGESVLDLYAGVGLFARFLSEAVGGGSVSLIEGDPQACDHAARNVPGSVVHHGDVAGVLGALPATPVDLVVLDPPRVGARREVVELIAARGPRAVAYVACDPAALARDVATFAEHGYELAGLRAFDLFPMTHHVECVALLTKTGSDLR